MSRIFGGRSPFLQGRSSGGMTGRMQDQLSAYTAQQQTGQAAVTDYLRAQGLPADVAGIFGPRLSMDQAQIAGLQYRGDEQARTRTEALNRMAEEQIQGRQGLASPMYGSMQRNVQQSLDRPLIDEYLRTTLLDQERQTIESQRFEAIERARERNSGAGVGMSGRANREVENINREYNARTTAATRDAGVQAGLYGQSQRNTAFGQGQQLVGRGDQLASELSGQYLNRTIQAPDYSALLAMGPASADVSYRGQVRESQSPPSILNNWRGQGDPSQQLRQSSGMSYSQGGQFVPPQAQLQGTGGSPGTTAPATTREYRAVNPYTGAAQPGGYSPPQAPSVPVAPSNAFGDSGGRGTFDGRAGYQNTQGDIDRYGSDIGSVGTHVWSQAQQETARREAERRASNYQYRRNYGDFVRPGAGY